MRFAVPSAVTVDAVGSYPAHACAWTTPCQVPPFHPYRRRACTLPQPCDWYLLTKEGLCRLAAAKSGRRYLSVALSVALGRLATACCARPLAGILLYGARTFLHMHMHAATAWRTSGMDSTAWRGQARDYLPDSTGGSARLTRPGSWVKPSRPSRSSNTPTGVPGSSGFCSNCCNWQVSVSAIYQRLP